MNLIWLIGHFTKVHIAHIQVSQGGEINEPIKIVILIQPIVPVEIKRNQARETNFSKDLSKKGPLYQHNNSVFVEKI